MTGAHSTDLGQRPLLEWLDLDGLSVDHAYQRPITKASERRIRKMVREFNWRDFTPLVVTPINEDGDFAVIDGQHRLEAAKLHPLVNEVPCYIVHADTLEEQAEGFLGINTGRVPISAVEAHFALVAKGDRSAIHIAEICRLASVTVSRSHKRSDQLPPGHTTAVGAIREAIAKFGEGATRKALDAIMLAHAETSGALSANLITALAGLYRQHDDEIDEEHLVTVLADIDPGQLMADAKAYRKIQGGTVRDALRIALMTAYNKGARGKLGDG